MAFEWLDKLQHAKLKASNYADKTLAAYALGMKARGSILGVAIEPGPDCCEAARHLEAAQVHHPSTAPRLPLPACDRGRRCQCVYRPVMSYQRSSEP